MDFFIRSDWPKPPENCDYCRAKKVENIIPKLKKYLGIRKKYDNKPVSSPLDKEILQKDIELRAKIRKILSKKELNISVLIYELLEDKHIRRLILRLDKQSKINDKAQNRYKQKKTKKMAVAKHIRIVQGGSPGLGKKA